MGNGLDYGRLIDALDKQETLVADLKRLRFWSRMMMVIVILMALLGVGLTAVAWQTRSLARGADENTSALEVVVAVQERERDLSALEACQVLNGANRETRAQFRLAYDTLAKVDPRSASLQLAVERLIAAIPAAEDQDRDCDGNGALTALDYPPDS